MKKVTIITTIVLMLAFVLPMARAQDKPATENSSTDPIKVEVQPSQTPETIEAGQDENEAQAQLLQAKQALQTQLQQLEIQKQKLQQQLQALTQAKQAEIQARQAEIQARQAKVKDKAVKVKASAEAHKAETEAEHWEQYAKKIEAWARQYEAQMNSPEVQERYKLLADNWVNSDQFKQWQKDMEQWSKEYAKAHKEYIEAHKEYTEGHKEYTEGHVQTESDDHDHTSAPDHPMHVMPPMPPMPAMPPMLAEILTPDVVAQAPMALPVTIAPAPPQPLTVVVPKVEPPAEIAAPAPVLPNITGAQSGPTPSIKIEKDKDGKFNATKEMHFVAKVKPGIPLVVRNSLGNIILKPGKEDICDVRAVISGKDKNQAKARAMIEQVSMNLHSTDERYYLKPVKSDGGQWSNLSVDFYITVPTGILPDVKTDLGNIEISNLQGKIKAVTDLGAIKAVNTTGEIDLFTSMGNIEFVAPRDLSAKLMVQTKMGEIKSELPLEINRADMFKRTTEGTIGAGGSTIKMATDMGKINLKWQSSPQVEVKL